MAEQPTITVLGSVNLDLIVQTQNLPKAGETVTGGTFTALPGGKGANVAVAAQRLGAKTLLIAATGEDDYAEQAVYYLTESRVDLSELVRLSGSHTGLAFITVSQTGENQIAVASGANAQLSPAHIQPITTDALITQFEIPMDVIIAATEGYTGFVSVNASPTTEMPSSLISRADLIIVNQGEYEFYKDRLNSFDGHLAVTLGKDGAQIYTSGERIAVSQPPKVKVIDTTGAGDSFAAALTLAYLEGRSPQEALDFACTVGALTTTQLGTQAASPNRDAVDSLLGL